MHIVTCSYYYLVINKIDYHYVGYCCIVLLSHIVIILLLVLLVDSYYHLFTIMHNHSLRCINVCYFVGYVGNDGSLHLPGFL